MEVHLTLPDSELKKAAYLRELAKESPLVVSQALMYARNLDRYGVDISQKWMTVAEQSAALEKAYERGYYEVLEAKERSNYEIHSVS